MSPAALSEDRFQVAQDAELQSWIRRSANARWIQRELNEHMEFAPVLRSVMAGRRFERALEVGVGAFGFGFLAVHLEDCARSIDGVDPLPRVDIRVPDAALQARAEEIRGRVHYVQARGEQLPFPDAAYDLACCINVIDHAQHPERILQEIGRVLRPGGWLVFSVSTLSLAGECAWRMRRFIHPSAWIFRAHPHEFQWPGAHRLLEQAIPGRTLWCDPPNGWARWAGHGRMSFWIREKS
jgi:SAM-dependent methyltransferase